MGKATEYPAADSLSAAAHFSKLLAFETDCSDVHQDLETGAGDFILLDVRGEDAFATGHIEGAASLPHSQICSKAIEPFSASALLIVYCAGPHCNGADKAALKLAALGRKTKKMLGGVLGWQSEGFELVDGI
ncbi:rhodanese-like domain-containing protein [Polycladidibacter hongkongensis]|uniref:rhodanese-like domain-containing protein n=1 Tax=Polycladidibacter hongkongensis TaxID=1647556 RepID=UPI0008315078|nr:rhodanese-like domain-containing protein [Pseudovibrio hongkongensis]